MADAVESATRSLQHPTEEDIRTMINGIFKGRILDGHLQDSGLTLGEIARMKESFFNTLRTMNHNRIAYPKPAAGDAAALLAARRTAEEKSDN
jgi:membrane-associated HD superfamily phosphohydrolase